MNIDKLIDLNSKIGDGNLFNQQIINIQLGLCPICGDQVKQEDFRNLSSIKEYKISKMCQKCQDEVFGED